MKYYKVKFEMCWEFIVNAPNEMVALEKIEEHVVNLQKIDGFATMSIKCIEEIKKIRYSIEDYDEFVLN